MKSNIFNYSLLAVGVAAVLGATSVANAAEPTGGASGTFEVTNQATALYTVAGNTTEQKAESNKVTVTVSETGSFSLVEDNTDATIKPQVGAPVSFNHTLTNAGNVDDTYTINISNETGDDFDYDLDSADTKITYKKNGDGADITVANGGTIDLAPGETAKITITASAATQRVIDANGVLTVTAESAYLKLKNAGVEAAYSAFNTDNAITTTPIYAITKSANTNLNNNIFDVNNTGAYVDYTITVKNEGSEKGTAVTIEDKLPTGLIAIQSGEPNYVAPTSSLNAKPVISSDGKTITVTGQDIETDETVTITFRAKKDDAVSNLNTGTDIVNFAVVRDDVNGDGTFDLIDSSGDALDTVTQENNYEDPINQPNVGKDNNDDATITTSSQSRDITITGGIEKEVALVSNNIYKYTITNNGTDITEANAPEEVYFTVTPTVDVTNIDIGTVFVDVNNNNKFDAGDIELTADASGNYDINDAITAGLAVDDSVEISVQVATKGTGSNLATGTNNLGDSEEMVITVLPQTIVDGTPAPADVDTISKTTMQGIDLNKYQAVADCTTAITNFPDDSPLWSQDPATADAGQCIFYKLEATNTFTSTDITGIAVSDTLDSQVNYRTDFTATPTATDDSSGSEVKGTFETLAGKTTGVIKFSVKTSQAGTKVTP